jgi:hypothetical protein
MTTTLTQKEKPDLLFNNPYKQKVYHFLKSNPGKDFEAFQVLTGETSVSKQLFQEVEQAIRAREERDRAKSESALKEVNALFLNRALSERAKGTASAASPENAKEPNLKKIEKKKQNARAKDYITTHPGCTYEELVQALGFRELSKPHFFSMKTLLRKKGLIPGESRTRRTRKGEGRSPAATAGSARTGAGRPESPTLPDLPTKTIEIVASIDAAGFSEELRDHYKSHFLPLVQKLWPGQGLHMVFLSDPPVIELRRAPR